MEDKQVTKALTRAFTAEDPTLPASEIRALVVESIGAAKKAVEGIIQFVP